MKTIDETKKTEIIRFINHYYSCNNACPSIRDISQGTGIAVTTVHRYLTRMKGLGELEYNGRRSISTSRIALEDKHYSIAVLGSVRCGPGEEEQERIVEYIRIPTAFVGRGDFFALIARGESMIEAGIHPGDYVIVRKQSTASAGEIVVALYNGLNTLKKLVSNNGSYLLRACNPDKTQFADIETKDLQIQGVAVGVYHKLL